VIQRTTAADGSYAFINLQDLQSYVLDEAVKPRWTRTGPTGPVTISLTGQSKEANLGNYNDLPFNVALTGNPSGSQKVGTVITWTASASDAEDLLAYEFWLSGPSTGGAWQMVRPFGANTWTWNTAGVPAGTYQVKVVVKDGEHSNTGDASATASVKLTSANRPPKINFIYTDRSSPQYAGTWVRWGVSATDPDGDQIYYRFLLEGPSTGYVRVDMTGWIKANSWIWRTGYADIDWNEITVEVRDGFHAGPGGADDRAKGGFLILPWHQPDLPPEITSFGSNLPSSQKAGATVTWTASAYSPEGRAVSYRFLLNGPSTMGQWKVVRDWSPSNVWSWKTSPVDIGLSQVEVWIRDGYHAGPSSWDDKVGAYFSVRSGAVVVPNQPPKLTALVPNKASPQSAGTAITWTATATDPDKDTISYKFLLYGPSTGMTWKTVRDWGTSASWTWNSAQSDAGDYSVYVYARDGKHAPLTGYDSALGKTFKLTIPQKTVQLSTGTFAKDVPRLIWADGGFVMAYQSWEKGRSSKGDLQVQRFDAAWKKQLSWASTSNAYEDIPSPIFADGYYYVAYVSDETGNLDINMKKFDSKLLLLETRKLISSPTDQDSPSLVRVGDGFVLAYQSWDSGPFNGGDIYVTKFDSRWNPLKTVALTGKSSYQDRPSIVYASGNLYVAYLSEESGTLDVWMKKLDLNMKTLDTRRITMDPAPKEFPYLAWSNGQFLLLYSTLRSGNYDIVMERFTRDWKKIDGQQVAGAPQSESWPSVAYSTVDGLYWVAYLVKESSGSNIYTKPLKLTAPAGIKAPDVSASFSATRSNRPYTLELRFYNSFGELYDPNERGLVATPKDAVAAGSMPVRVSTGVYKMTSEFGERGDKSFRITANIDGSFVDKTFKVKVT
jgi:hypothetical protein